MLAVLSELVADKLKVYRLAMIVLIAVMGTVSVLLGSVMKEKVREITEVWSPSLAAVQELEKATGMVNLVFLIMVLGIMVMAGIAAILATFIGNTISRTITEPVAQIEEAIVSMREGDFSKADVLRYESGDELGVVSQKLKEALIHLSGYAQEISDELKRMAAGDLTRNREDIRDFLGEFSSVKESFILILKNFNHTLAEIQTASASVASDAAQIAGASQTLSEGAGEQAGAVEELTATIETVSNLAAESAKATQRAYEQVSTAVEKAETEKQKMTELTAEMGYITDISKEIADIITAIEDIASQTNLLSLNASIEAARAGEAGKGFAVVADQIGSLAADSARSAVNTRELIHRTLQEIEKGNAIALSTSESFDQIILDMKSFAGLARQTTENANEQAEALLQVEQGIEQISGAVQSTAAASEENTAVSVNLSEKSVLLDELLRKFVINKKFHNA